MNNEEDLVDESDKPRGYGGWEPQTLIDEHKKSWDRAISGLTERILQKNREYVMEQDDSYKKHILKRIEESEAHKKEAIAARLHLEKFTKPAKPAGNLTTTQAVAKLQE